MVTTIYLIRHGEAEGNVKKFFQGNIETSLTDRGIQQAGYAGERLKDIPIDCLWSSPLKRAYMTAEGANRYKGLEIQTDKRLMEINGGDFEGLPWEELPQKFPEAAAKWHDTVYDFKAPGGESMEEVYDRMRDCITEIAEKNKGRTVCIVSHGCSLRAFLCFVKYGDIRKINQVEIGKNTAFSCLEYKEGSFEIKFANDISHLPEKLRETAKPGWFEDDKTE